MSGILQTRCSKCGLPLENQQRLLIGLGKDCEANAHLAYLADVQHLKELTGDTLFNFLAIFGNVSSLGIPKELEPTLERLSFALINHNPGQTIPFSVVLDSFSIARNSNELITTQIHRALNELGFVRFVNLASGQTCPGKAILDYNTETKRILLSATVRRCASEVFNKMKHKRPDTNIWIFESLRDAVEIFNTVQLRWPLPDAFIITDAFYDALELAKNLPPEEVEPESTHFHSEVLELPPQRLLYVRIAENDEAARRKEYTIKYNLSSTIYPFIMHPSIGGVYRKNDCTEAVKVYQLAEDKLEVVEAFLKNLYASAEPKKKGKR